MNLTQIDFLSRTSRAQAWLTLDSELSGLKNRDIWVCLGLRHTCTMWELFSVHRHTYVYVKVRSTRSRLIACAIFQPLVYLALIIGRNITLGSWLTLIRFSSSQMETMQVMSSLNPLLESCQILLQSKCQKAKMSTRSIKRKAQTTSKKKLRARDDR